MHMRIHGSPWKVCQMYSGFEEILLDSGICARGSIEKVITGKHYNRVIFVHKIVAKGLECLLLMKFEETRDGRIRESNLSEAGT